MYSNILEMSIGVAGHRIPQKSAPTCRDRSVASDVWGFVLLNVATGKEPEFFSNLGSIQQVRHVFYIFDDYEYLVELETETPQEMAKVMTNHIRHLPGVERTATFIEGTQGAACPTGHPAVSADTPVLW